ncbi:MAG: XrtA/PEP-CTERM system histidine kinase PrsK [Pseudomonadota bacterium]
MLDNIGFVSYVTAAVAFLILFLVLLTGIRGRAQNHWLLAIAFISTLWAATAAYQSLSSPARPLSQVIEPLRYLALLQFLVVVLMSGQQDSGARDRRLRRMARAGYVLVAAAFGLALLQWVSGRSLVFLESIDLTIGAYLLLATAGLALIEQLVRNARSEAMRATKYFCLGLGGIFAYDFYFYADALMFQRIDVSLWDARGFVNACVVPVIGIGLARNPRWTPDIFISRRIVFHTTALFFAGVYLVTMGFGGYYVREVGGTWGGVAQASLLFVALMTLLILFFSGPLRARLRVLINKHFFQYKYDYREEWLRFIRTLSTNDPDVQLHVRVIRAMAQIIDSPGAMLWMRRGSIYEEVVSWNMPLSRQTMEPAHGSFCHLLEQREWVINLDEHEQGARPAMPGSHQFVIPDWLRSIRNAWLVVPLIVEDGLTGFVILARSEAHRRHFNWEDCDLLKTAGRQAASYLAQCEASQALAVARQFEAFNRMSTYVVHDLKNLIAQLSLVVSNAARHKHNPLFMQDAISTVENSVAKMNRLLAHLRSGGHQSSPSPVDLEQLLGDVVRAHSASRPVPSLDCDLAGAMVMADRDRFSAVIGHILQNAHDATSESGSISVRGRKHGNIAAIEVEDTGSGMDEDFIRERLFRPFDSTKNGAGMGIGAYEVREYVRSLGGDVQVVSAPGKGTTFRIRLPYADRLHMEEIRQQGIAR